MGFERNPYTRAYAESRSKLPGIGPYWDLAKEIVRKRDSYVGHSGIMYINITEAVAKGIKLGVELGKKIERNDIIDEITKRDVTEQ